MDIIAQAEDNITKEKEAVLVQYAERVLREIEEDENAVAIIKSRIESKKDCLDKIATRDEVFMSKIVTNMQYGAPLSSSQAAFATVSGSLRG